MTFRLTTRTWRKRPSELKTEAGGQTVIPERKKCAIQYRRMLVYILVAMLSPCPGMAQMGPLATDGYLEYRFDHVGGTNSANSNGAILKTNLSTYFWRPWILTATGNVSFSQNEADSTIGTQKSVVTQGGLRLNFLPRSRFPLTIYYEDRGGKSDSDAYSRSGTTRDYGLLQQFMSKRFGHYALDWQKGYTDSLNDGVIQVQTRKDYDRLRLDVSKSIGRNTFLLGSRRLEVTAISPGQRLNSIRHNFRHSFRPGSRVDIRNTFYYGDEQQETDTVAVDRVFQQFSSTLSWRPRTEKRLLLTGRGLLQSSESLTQFLTTGQKSASLSATASYEYSDRVMLSGSVGVLSAGTDTSASTFSTYQQAGATYRSTEHNFLGGTYAFRARTAIGSRTDPGDVGDIGDNRDEDTRILTTGVGHSLGRSFAVQYLGSVQLRASQDVATSHDTNGREINTLRHGIFLATSGQSADYTRYLRVSLTDQRSFGDERRVYQLADLQLSLRRQISRDRNWNGNITLQYGRREQYKPLESAAAGASFSYSVNLSYRHANLFDVSLLNFTSDFRLLSTDLQTDDPFDLGFDLETQQLMSTWRNRIEYRVGLLHLRADADLRETGGDWNTSIRISARRYFGMR